MFDDFRSTASTPGERARFRGSLAAALVLYGGVSALLVGASATARQIVEEKLTQVEFAAPPPEPPPAPTPPEPVPAAASPRPKAKRKDLKPPDEVPEDKPRESDEPLAAAGETGPVDGFLDGVEGGKGAAPAPPPPPPPQPVLPPVALRTNTPPRYSPTAKLSHIEGTVVVAFEVLEDGRVTNARIVSGPRELHDSVLEAVASWRFQPARQGGTPVRFRKTQSIVFRLEGA